MANRVSNLCVYCGSSPGKDPAFGEQAHALGRLMAQNGVGLVYGGGDAGLMGTIAKAVLAGGGRVTGIIPTFFLTEGFDVTADGLDGAVARATRKTDFGGYLDITCDFLFYGAIPLAFVLHN
ncbi:MAG: hypothetical protein AAGK33_13200, partial [Pseudomonadota bacterium]